MNAFLNDFIRRQGELIESTVPPSGGAGGRGGRKKHKSRHGTADGKAPFGGDDMVSRLTQICTEKPKKKVVLEYFRDRIAELVAAEEY